MKFMSDNKNLLNRLDEKLQIIQHKRPLSPGIVNKLREQFAIEMTYNSNAIEGNRLTLKETYLVVDEGITVKGKSLKEHLEAKNHYEAVHFLYDLVEHEKKHTISEQLVRSLQQLIIQEHDKSIAGVYRTGSVFITGSKHQPPEALDIPLLMKNLLLWTNKNIKKLHPIELATIFHHKITNIHPFFDGNGRTARLTMNLLLMQEGYPIVSILKNDRKKYYSVLEKADLGNIEPLLLFIIQAVERSLNIYLKVIGKSTEKNKLFPLSTLAEKTQYSQKYLNLLIRQGKIEAHKEGRNWVSSVEAIESYIKNRQRKRKI